MHWNQKNTIFYFYYPSQNFALWQKIAVTQNFYPNFFYSLDPPLSEFKVKIRGHPFAYRCYSSNRTITRDLKTVVKPTYLLNVQAYG